MTERLHFHFSLSCIGEGNGSPLWCSCLENPRDGRAWRAAVSGVAQSRTRLKRLSSSSNKMSSWHFQKVISNMILWRLFLFGWSVSINNCSPNILLRVIRLPYILAAEKGGTLTSRTEGFSLIPQFSAVIILSWSDILCINIWK